MHNVTFAAALVAGIVSFLSPCVLPLVPPYLVYLTGTSIEHLAEGEPEVRVRRETVGAALLFVLGFSTVFVALGASASVIGALLLRLVRAAVDPRRHRHHHHGAAFPRPHPHRPADAGEAAGMAKPVGLWGAYVMGLAFAFGWTPCIGPILAAILAVAASEKTVAQGRRTAGDLFARASAFRSCIAAFAVEPFAAFLARFKRHLGTVEKVMGGLLVLTGVAFLTGFVTTTSAWLLETFPGSARSGEPRRIPSSTTGADDPDKAGPPRMTMRSASVRDTKPADDGGLVTAMSCVASCPSRRICRPSSRRRTRSRGG